MTQEDKELLLKDLCARLPYKVKIDNGGIGKTVESITIKPDYIEIVIKGAYAYSHFIHRDTGEWDNYDDLSWCKPYLRPISSITEKERQEYEATCTDWYETLETYDWLNSHHFDYRNLIKCGLAIEAPKDMYK